MSANRELNHNHVALPTLASLKRKKCAVEVWNDTPAEGEPPHIVLGIEAAETEYVDLLPAEEGCCGATGCCCRGSGARLQSGVQPCLRLLAQIPWNRPPASD